MPILRFTSYVCHLMLCMMVSYKWRYKTRPTYSHMLALITLLLLQFIVTHQVRVTPPIITAEPQKVIVFREGESLVLECLASGEPEPSYSWKKDGNVFNINDLDGRIGRRPGVGTLIFQNPQQQDEGVYQCFAANRAGVALSAKIYLIKAKLDTFPASAVREHYPQLGRPLTLRCVAPVSFPAPNIFWATTAGGSGMLAPIDYTDRVTMDLEGNLHFVNILPEDKRDGQTYTCVVMNRVMRSVQQGEYAVIRPQGHTILRSGPNLLWASPTYNLALRGETFRLMCIFSGSPAPRVDWSRIGGNMTSRGRTGNFGLELLITDVQFEDAGRYECQGINDEAQMPHRRSFHLSVEAAPYWIEPIESQHAGEGDTVEFSYKTGGIPQPAIKWFLNGRPLTELPPQPRMEIEPGKLTFYNVTEEDTQVIQCNSTNKHGYLWTNAYLSVTSEPPVILEPPQSAAKAAVGQTIQIPCKVFGSPKPQVTWTKNNQQLAGETFTVLENGSLEIKEVSRSDAGIYKCTAQNKFGIVNASGMFIVREPTRILIKPRDRIIKEGTEVTLRCMATTDPREFTKLRIVWQRNYRDIDFQQSQRYTQSRRDNSLTIWSPIPRDTGNYTCVASNGIDLDQWTAQLTVQAPPDPPRDVRVAGCDGSAAMIVWQPGRDNNAEIINFIIQFNTSFAPDSWTNIVTNVPQFERRWFVSLSPWANYTFRVLARNKIGTSLPSLHTYDYCTTRTARPYKNPDNVMGEGDQPGNLVIFWTPMPQLEWNGPSFKYRVTWQPADVANAPVNSAIIFDGEQRYFVTGITTWPYAPFRITVTAMNAEGQAVVPPVSIIGHAGEDHPVVAPYNLAVQADSVKANQAVLTWSHVDQSPQAIRGFFCGYRIEFWRTEDNGENMREEDYTMHDPRPYPIPRRFRRDVNENNTARVTVNHLPAYSNVTVQVRVLNKYYAGPASNQIQFTTMEGQPGPPLYLHIVSRGPTFFSLEWAKPQEPNGNVVGYKIAYQIVNGLNLGMFYNQELIRNSETLHAQLTDLLPNTLYRIHLSAYTIAGMGEPIYLQVQTTPSPPGQSVN